MAAHRYGETERSTGMRDGARERPDKAAGLDGEQIGASGLSSKIGTDYRNIVANSNRIAKGLTQLREGARERVGHNRYLRMPGIMKRFVQPASRKAFPEA
jgi:hypothetical protein